MSDRRRSPRATNAEPRPRRKLDVAESQNLRKEGETAHPSPLTLRIPVGRDVDLGIVGLEALVIGSCQLHEVVSWVERGVW